MKSLAWLAAAAFMDLPGAPVQAQAWGALPAVELRLQCYDDGAEHTAAEIEAIQDLHDFARGHDAEVVWLDVVIAADAGAGACSRDVSEFPDQPPPTGERARIVFQPCARDARAGTCRPRDGAIRITANGPPLAYSHGVHLPPEAALDPGLPYRYGRYGDWLNYQGPFVVRFFEGTGYAYATFHPPHPGLPGVWERARCNARPDACAPQQETVR